MKRVIMASIMLVVLVCATAHGARAELVPVRILIGGREATVAPSAVWDGKRVLAPIGVLSSLGAQYLESTDDKKLAVVSADGQSAEIETIHANRVNMLPMDKVLALIGGESTWDADSKTLNLIALVRSVEFVDETLKINCSFPVGYTVKPWVSSNRLIIDVPSAKIESDAREVYIGAGKILRARLGTDKGNARIVLDMEKNVPYKVTSDPVAARIEVKVSESIPKPKAKIAMEAKEVSNRPFTISGIRVDAVDDTRFDVVISTSRKGSAAVANDMAPPEITLYMSGGTLEETAMSHTGSHSMLKSLKIVKDSKTKVALQLNRVMVSALRVDESSITLSVRPPDKSGGKLADKLIVIDPGHGGKQKGACCVGIEEKNVNVKIANELVAALKAEGARTILTRTSDVEMGLAARPEMALAAGADFFVSIHCNSNGTKNSASGIETYYHSYEPSPMALAFAVHEGVCSATGMCDRKPRSDRSLYESGLAVLRRLENTGLPGILLECGYLNHSSDRAKLLDDGYRKKLAAGIVSGLKAYVEGTPVR